MSSQLRAFRTPVLISPVATMRWLPLGIWRVVADFFSQPTHPLNLAVVRILVFYKDEFSLAPEDRGQPPVIGSSSSELINSGSHRC
jgi:hypothetical protein